MATLKNTLAIIVVLSFTCEIAKGRVVQHHHRHNGQHRFHPHDTEKFLPKKLPLDDHEKRYHDPTDIREHRNHATLGLQEHLNFEEDFLPARVEARRKRHNNIHANVRYRKMNEEDRVEYRNHALNVARNKRYDDHFELEVKEAQNSSICNYTVVPIPDTRGNRIQKELEHVMCNHAGSRCQSVGAYCCIQTYRMIEVAYTDNSKEEMKIYAGCVCSLQLYEELEQPKLSLDD